MSVSHPDEHKMLAAMRLGSRQYWQNPDGSPKALCAALLVLTARRVSVPLHQCVLSWTLRRRRRATWRVAWEQMRCRRALSVFGYTVPGRSGRRCLSQRATLTSPQWSGGGSSTLWRTATWIAPSFRWRWGERSPLTSCVLSRSRWSLTRPTMVCTRWWLTLPSGRGNGTPLTWSSGSRTLRTHWRSSCLWWTSWAAKHA